MAFDLDQVLAKDTFSTLNLEQKSILKELFQKLQGKNSAEAMLILMNYNSKYLKDIHISEEQLNLMLEASLESMPPTDKEKFMKIISMAKNFSK